jgi:threonine/homoserine/homoserine lactone efflux protein
VIFGVSVILVKSAELFFLVKMAGAVYLCWIGIKAVWEAWRGMSVVPEVRPERERGTLAAAYVEGFLTNALNPKVAVFYLAAFPQFLPIEHQGVGSTFVLVFIHAALNFVWFGAMVLVLSRFVGHLRSGGLQRLIKGITGIVLLGFGARLAVIRP